MYAYVGVETMFEFCWDARIAIHIFIFNLYMTCVCIQEFT